MYLSYRLGYLVKFKLLPGRATITRICMGKVMHEGCTGAQTIVSVKTKFKRANQNTCKFAQFLRLEKCDVFVLRSSKLIRFFVFRIKII